MSGTDQDSHPDALAGLFIASHRCICGASRRLILSSSLWSDASRVRAHRHRRRVRLPVLGAEYRLGAVPLAGCGTRLLLGHLRWYRSGSGCWASADFSVPDATGHRFHMGREPIHDHIEFWRGRLPAGLLARMSTRSAVCRRPCRYTFRFSLCVVQACCAQDRLLYGELVV